MKTRTLIILLLLVPLVLPSCRQGGKPVDEPRTLHSFSLPEVPSVYSGTEERRQYLLDHYWDRFFAGEGPCDTGAVLGVKYREVELAFASYVDLIRELPLPEAQKQMGRFFGRIEQKQAADTSVHVYPLMTEIVSRYLYDPNSPWRDEDLYLPFAEGLAASPFTLEDARPGYVYEAQMCALNPVGSVAPDFRFTDLQGRTRSLHQVRARTTVLFFSNPGCYACQEIIGTLQAIPGIDARIDNGSVAVVCVYIDEDLDKWREYAPAYPARWLCGYEGEGRIREAELYNVRAIPSLYLLDADKRILLKDAPTERVVSYLQNYQNQ